MSADEAYRANKPKTTKKAPQHPTAVRTQAFHDFYSEIFTPKRWARLYQALSQSTDLVAVVNPYVPTRWAAKELNSIHAKPSTAFNSLFQKGLPIFELPQQTQSTLQSGGHSSGTNHSLESTPDAAKRTGKLEVEKNHALTDVEDKGFTSRWPIRLPQVGHQPGDNQLDLALAMNNGDVAGIEGGISIDSENPNQLEHIAMAGGYLSGFGPTKDKLGWYLMDLASIAAPLILNPQPGEKVLDLCAAPGGKSLILAYLMLFREKLTGKMNEINSIMQRHHDFTYLSNQQQNNAQNYTSWEEESVFSPSPEFISRYQTTIDQQTPDTFQQVASAPTISNKKSQRFLQRFQDLFNDTQQGFQSQTPLDEHNNNIPSPDVTTTMTNAKSQVSYENDEIIQAIMRSRNHSSFYKTKNQLDREKFEEEQKYLFPQFLAEEQSPTSNTKQDKTKCDTNYGQTVGGYDDDNDDEIQDCSSTLNEIQPPQQKNPQQLKTEQIALSRDLYADLQYEREMRQLHSQILNPLALRKQMNISDSSSSGEDNDSDNDNEALQQKNQVGKNKVLPVTTPSNPDENPDQRRARLRAEKEEKKAQLERQKQEKRNEKAKHDSLRLRSRLVLNDISIPRVKRLQKVIQSYLPMKYVPLVEITNVDASTAQQFTLVTRNSYGDVSVKKIQKKGSGSALESAQVRERMKEGEYDCVLVDAPCSSDRHIIHDNSLATWNIAYTKAQAKRQYGLLLAAIKSLKVGGRCVYSTCSLSPFENDGVVSQVIKTLGDEVVKVVKFKLEIGEKTGLGWILLPDQPNCSWGPLYISFLQRVG